ncbi:MAG: bacteriohemerythrin [Candidatus Solibacter sp.]
MSLFKWSSDYSVYLPEIDAEHRTIFRLANDFHKALLTGQDQERLQDLAVGLLAAEEQHFRHEERLMKAMHYNGTVWHKKQHDTARKRSRELAKRIQEGDANAVMDVLKFLSQWMNDHITVADRMMSASLRNYLCFNTSLAS